MIDNPMAMHNGYGKSDPQEQMIDHPVEDALGNEILPGDELLIAPDGEVVLKDNIMDYMITQLGFEKKTAGE
ncbi:YqaI family protein [Bacillus thuringiensis]|uniref:YqaI family protein n=1 Tax=Bacillus thuringiensis TaxID=1428 RepID=UPI003F6CE20E